MTDNSERVLSALSMAMKAGKLKHGGVSTENAIKGGEACLVIVAEDASENTAKHYGDMCAYRGIPLIRFSDMETLGKRIGKDDRSTLAVTDEGFAKMITRLTEVANR